MAIATGTALALSAAGSALAGIGGAVIGNMESANDRKLAADAQRKALAEIEKLGAGPDLAKEIFLKEFKVAGVLTPELEREVDKGVSKVAQIQEDPRLKKAQMDALSAIQERGRTGFTPEEAMQLRKERATAERSAEAKRQQILAGLRARGALDSGAGIAAQLQSADELAAQQAEASDRFSGMASQRALQAMTQGGELAGSIRGREFDIAQRKAGSEEEMQRFNIANRGAQEQRRAEREMAARQYNLGIAQDVANKVVAQQNQEALRRGYTAPMQMRQDQLNVAGMKAGAYTGQAQQLQQQAAQTQQGWAQMGSAVGGAIGSVGQYAINAPLRQSEIAANYAKAGYKYNNLTGNWEPPGTTVSPASVPKVTG